MKVELKKRPCNCGFKYHFPHALGRGWCRYNEKLTDGDWEEFFTGIRSG